MILITICTLGTTLTAFAQNECTVRVGEYSGTVKAEWLTKTREMRLLEPFSFKGPDCKVWPVPKGAVVDGASIPQPFWSLIGGPFEGRYRDASVVHDYYCKVRIAPSDEVHEMFYHAMLANGVNSNTAGAMYYAVRWFGPQWQVLKKIGDAGGFETYALLRSSKDFIPGPDFYRKASAAAGQPSPIDARIDRPYTRRSQDIYVDLPWLYADGKVITAPLAKPNADAWTRALYGQSLSVDVNAVTDAIRVYSTGSAARAPSSTDVEQLRAWIERAHPNLATLKATPPHQIPRQ